MKKTKYTIFFQDGTQQVAEADYMAAGLILAQAKQLEKKKSIIPITIHEYVNKVDYLAYSPLYHFKAHQVNLVQKKTVERQETLGV